MKYRLKKVAVLGSGVMGSGIACHLANVGMEVLMLDIVPKEAGNDKTSRNLMVNTALQTAIKSKPAPLYDKTFASRIQTGNFEDDFDENFVRPHFLIIFIFVCTFLDHTDCMAL